MYINYISIKKFKKEKQINLTKSEKWRVKVSSFPQLTMVTGYFVWASFSMLKGIDRITFLAISFPSLCLNSNFYQQHLERTFLISDSMGNPGSLSSFLHSISLPLSFFLFLPPNTGMASRFQITCLFQPVGNGCLEMDSDQVQ